MRTNGCSTSETKISFGDEIIAAGHAQVEYERTGERVTIVDFYGVPRWSSLWDGNPAIVPRTGKPIKNAPRCRPYIRYPFTQATGCKYSGWRARDHRGRIYLTDRELSQVAGSGYVVVEPHIANGSNRNKQWHGYQALIDKLDLDWVQIGPPGTEILNDARHIVTPTFRDGCAVLSKATAYVGPECGLHHAAAVLDTPAVVIFGGSPSVEATGYPEQINFADPEPCGQWLPCRHCASAMRNITVDQVANALVRLLET